MALLDPDTLYDQYDLARTAFRPYFDQMYEWERIARNKPHPQVIAAKLPTVTDGTLASVIQAQPRRVIQRLPTGRVTAVEQPSLVEIADFIWQYEILPRANDGGDVLQKSWIALEKSKTYGCQPAFVYFGQHGDYFGADFNLPYVKDVLPEIGKLNANDSKVTFMQSWWTEAQIQNLIDREGVLEEAATARNEKYESKWDVGCLKKSLEKLRVKDPNSETPTEKTKGALARYALFVHAFEEGVSKTFYTFNPDLAVGDQILRKKVNPDPRGRIPIIWLYDKIDLSSPYGRGSIELSGAMQNLIDSEVQSYQFMQKLMLNPPIMKYGTTVRTSTIKWKPNTVWDMGADPNAKIEPVPMASEALSNFTNNYGLMKSQILQLTGNTDTGVGAGSGDPNSSKTQAGVNAKTAAVNVDDNYMRKQFETWFEDIAETMLNIHFAEASGNREIELTEDWLEKAKPLAPDAENIVKIDQDKKTATVDYEAIETRLRYRVNPTSTKVPDDADQVDKLHELLADTGQNLRVIAYFLRQDGWDIHFGEMYRELFSRLGIEALDTILTKMTEEEQAQAQQDPFPIFDMAKLRGDLKDMHPVVQSQVLGMSGVNVDPQVLAQPDPMTEANVRNLPINSPNYVNVPEDVKRQMEQASGYKPSAMLSPAGSDQFEAHASGMQDAANNEVQNAQAVAQAAQPPEQGNQPPQPQETPAPPSEQPQGQDQAAADQELMQAILNAGFSSQQAAQAVLLLHHGYSQEQILQLLTQAQGGSQ